MKKRRIVKRVVSFMIAVVMVVSLLVGVEPVTVRATTTSGRAWSVETDEGATEFTGVTYQFTTGDTAEGTWYLYLWEKGDTSGQEGRPAILAETSLEASDGTHSMTISYAGTFGTEYMLGIVLKDSGWSTGNTEEMVDWPYLTEICDAEDLNSVTGGFVNGLSTNRTLSDIFVNGWNHSWSYTAEGNTITANCSEGGECPYSAGENTLTLTAEDADYCSGSPYDEPDNVVLTDAGGNKVTDGRFPGSNATMGDVRYYLSDGTTLTSADNSGAESEGGAPENVGNYVAKVTLVAKDGSEYTAECAFAIREVPDCRTINLNVTRDDGSHVIAGITDPGQPNNSKNEGNSATTSAWGKQKDASGDVIKSGSYVYYGNYQQSKDEENSTAEQAVYKTEPIKWRVLDADTTAYDAGSDNPNHTMLLLSNQILDKQRFNVSYGEKDDSYYKKDSNGNLTSYLANDYLYSDLRSWLNNDFVTAAFSAAEQKGIAASSKSAADGVIGYLYKDNSGLSNDKVFALSADEADDERYGFYSVGSTEQANGTTSFARTAYASGQGLYSNYWWLRSAYSTYSDITGQASSNGGLEAYDVDSYDTGVVPALNLDLSTVLFASVSGAGKSSAFAPTSASEGKEWNLTMAGGDGFAASLQGDASAAYVKVNEKLTVDISTLGTPEEGVEYTQISAMLVDENHVVTAYGKVAEADAASAEITIPEEIGVGNYTLKVFAEDVNSTAENNLTDYASNVVDIPVSVCSYSISVTNPSETHITRMAADGNGTEQQKVVDAGDAMTPIAYTAEAGYYFPVDYSVTESKGITVTRDSASRITVSGTPTGDVDITLTAATEKGSQSAPTGLGEAEGKITGTTETMEYREKPEEESGSDTGWADCEVDATVVEPGTYEVRYKETDTMNAGAVAEVTVRERYTVAVANPADSHITRLAADGNGTERQKVVDGDAMTPIVYTAEAGYYFPADYSVTGSNGITVTRDSASQITVSGTPTGDVDITLTAAVIDAATPEITTQPAAGATYTAGDATKALTVAANVADGGSLSYQWYKNATNTTTEATAISGATAASYTPATTTAGTTYYYCVVTNTNTAATGVQTATSTSTIAKVVVNAKIVPVPETKTYSVIFNSDGGSKVAAQTVKEGATATKPADPTRKGYKFAGWYVGNTAYNFAAPVTADTTLKAKWTVIKVTKVAITGSSKQIAAGKKIALKATVTPSTALNTAVTWKSSNTKYATVTSKGVVTLKKAGAGKTVKITATAKDGSKKKATYTIKIMKNAVKSIALKAGKTTVTAGGKVTVKATVSPATSVNKTLTWKSSNTKYATVTSKGVVTTKKAGKGKTVTITATATDGSGKKKTIKIKIK